MPSKTVRSKAKSRPKRGGSPVDAYLAKLRPESRRALARLRRAIRSAAPGEATEIISYGIPAFRYKGLLAWYAAFPTHCSFFPRVSAIRKFRRELKGFVTSKGTIRFTPERPLPLALIRRIVRARVREIDGAKAGT